MVPKGMVWCASRDPSVVLINDMGPTAHGGRLTPWAPHARFRIAFGQGAFSLQKANSSFRQLVGVWQIATDSHNKSPVHPSVFC